MNVTLDQARTGLKELIKASTRGERVIITEDDRPVAELLAVSTGTVPRFGSCRDMIRIISDDEDHLQDFEEYMP